MSTYLFDMFKFAKLLDLTNGNISLMSTPVNIVPTYLLCEQQKMLVDTLGLSGAYEKIYASSKNGSLEYNLEFIKKEKFSDKRKTIDWQTKIVTFAGWGDIEMALIDLDNSKFILHFKNSPYPKSYGSVKYAVDFIAAGFVAGGLSAMAGEDLDSVETKCQARGDPFCVIETNKPEIISAMRLDLWKSWGVL